MSVEPQTQEHTGGREKRGRLREKRNLHNFDLAKERGKKLVIST